MRTRETLPPYFLGIRLLKKALPDGLTAQELAEEANITKRNMLKYIKIWREEHRILILGWQRPNRGDWMPVYAWRENSKQRDAQKPKPLTAAEKQAAYRERHKAELSTKRRLKRAQKLGIQNHTPFSHLNAWSGLVS